LDSTTGRFRSNCAGIRLLNPLMRPVFIVEIDGHFDDAMRMVPVEDQKIVALFSRKKLATN